MELFLLGTAALFRPIASGAYILSGAFTEIAAVLLFVVLCGAFFANSALRKQTSFSAIDLTIVGFSTWCLAGYVAYFDVARLADMARLLVPLLTYTVTKNIVKDRDEYRRLLSWMIVGFSVPVVLSAALIAAGKGVAYVSYWTGIARYQGAYDGAHNLGHSMTFFLFLLILYRGTARLDFGTRTRELGSGEKIILSVLGGLALYCLYMSQVRSAILGFAIFFILYFYHINRKLLILGAAAVAIIGLALLPRWLPALLPDVVLYEEGRIDAGELGSGRQGIWAHQIKVFAEFPIDQKLAGAGIGNKDPTGTRTDVLDSHNDWLDLPMQTGIVGLTLFVLLQFLILRAILKLRGQERYFFLAMFVAVNFMMAVSNSYVYRIAVCQTYYMVLALIELRHSKPLNGGGRSSSAVGT